MPYDPAQDPHATAAADPLLANGSEGRVLTPSNTVDITGYPRAVVTLTAGNLAYVPSKNADGDVLSFVDLPAGWVSPHRVRRVMATGTTATVATIEG